MSMLVNYWEAVRFKGNEIADEIFLYRKENVHVVTEAKVEERFLELVDICVAELEEEFPGICYEADQMRNHMISMSVTNFMYLCA